MFEQSVKKSSKQADIIEDMPEEDPPPKQDSPTVGGVIKDVIHKVEKAASTVVDTVTGSSKREDGQKSENVKDMEFYAVGSYQIDVLNFFRSEPAKSMTLVIRR
jgi:hypothetical protein